MKLLDHERLTRITRQAVAGTVKAEVLCVIQDRTEGWTHLATCICKLHGPIRGEHVVWRINLNDPGAFSGNYFTHLDAAWNRFVADVPKRILTEPGSRVGNEVLVKHESKKRLKNYLHLTDP